MNDVPLMAGGLSAGVAPVLTLVATVFATYLLHSVVCCAIALALGRVLKRPGDRDVLWKVALIAPIVTSLALASGRIDPRGTLNLAEQFRPFSPDAMRRVEVRREVIQLGDQRRVREQIDDRLSLWLSLALIGLVVARAAVGAHEVVATRRKLFRPLASRRPFTPADRAAAEWSPRVRVSECTDIVSPLALPGREICLPAGSFSMLSAAQQASVMAHECAHVARRDPEWLAAGEWIAALTSWQPMVGVVVARLRRDAEFICDEIAVARVGDARPLVESMATFAEPWDAHRRVAVAYGTSPLVARATRALALSVRGGADVKARVGGLVAAAVLVASLVATPALSLRAEAPPADPTRSIVLDPIIQDSVIIVRQTAPVR